MSHALALWISVLLLLGNAFFVGAEFAAMAARRSRLEPMAAAGSARARMSLAMRVPCTTSSVHTRTS